MTRFDVETATPEEIREQAEKAKEMATLLEYFAIDLTGSADADLSASALRKHYSQLVVEASQREFYKVLDSLEFGIEPNSAQPLYRRLTESGWLPPGGRVVAWWNWKNVPVGKPYVDRSNRFHLNMSNGRVGYDPATGDTNVIAIRDDLMGPGPFRLIEAPA